MAGSIEPETTVSANNDPMVTIAFRHRQSVKAWLESHAEHVRGVDPSELLRAIVNDYVDGYNRGDIVAPFFRRPNTHNNSHNGGK